MSLSMMVVVLAVAGKSALAQDGEQDTEADHSAPAAVPDGVDADAPTDAADDTGSRRKRRAKIDAAGTEAPAQPARFGGPAERNHRLQTGLSIMPGTGYRLIVRYKETQSCGDPSGIADKPVCSRRLPTFLDFQLSFGAMSRMDIIVDLRFGLEQDPAVKGSHQFALAPGFRFWLDQEIALKFYSTLQFVYDYTYFPPNASTPSSDLGVRNANGLMYDPIRNVGFFVQFGETMGFRRWFRIDLDVGFGAQIRFP